MKVCIDVIRKRQGLTQQALADKVNVSLSHRLSQDMISRIETGTRHLRAAELSAFAAALGCTMEELLGNLSPQANTPTEEKIHV